MGEGGGDGRGRLVGRSRPLVTEMASGLMTVVSMVWGKLIPVEREEGRKGDR